MGTDGAGKSSILNEIDKRLRNEDHHTLKIWARYSPGFIKIFVNIFRKRSVPGSTNYNDISEQDYSAWQSGKRKITRNRIVRKILLNVFFLDYYSQIVRVIKKIEKNRDKIILIDRFVIDFLADQTVNFGDISDTRIYRKLIKICNRLDAVFLISVAPETALARKNDIPGQKYLTERDIIYKKIFRNLKNGHIIDNNGDPEIAVNEILNIIMP